MKIWSDVEYVYRCLADVERTEAFREAIEAAVKPGDVVLDLGSGSGIMALLAIRAGAERVFSVEVGPYLSRISRQVFDDSGYGARITTVRADARKLDLSIVEKPDVVICEMITTALIGEMQGPVISSLRRSGVIDDSTGVIPGALSTSVTLVHADFMRYGIELHFPMFVDYFARTFDHRFEALSQEEVVHAVDFSREFSEEIRIDTRVRVADTSRINGILLTSATDFVGGRKLGTCVSYCQPVILPVRPEMDALAGDTMRVTLRYRMGGGFDSLKYAVQRADVGDDTTPPQSAVLGSR